MREEMRKRMEQEEEKPERSEQIISRNANKIQLKATKLQ